MGCVGGAASVAAEKDGAFLAPYFEELVGKRVYLCPVVGAEELTEGIGVG